MKPAASRRFCIRCRSARISAGTSSARGFFKGQICGFQGGYVPFSATAAERLANGDPRPSLEERYGALEGYVCAVRQAADKAVSERFLLRDDADRLISRSGTQPGAADPRLEFGDASARAGALCAAQGGRTGMPSHHEPEAVVALALTLPAMVAPTKAVQSAGPEIRVLSNRADFVVRRRRARRRSAFLAAQTARASFVSLSTRAM